MKTKLEVGDLIIIEEPYSSGKNKIGLCLNVTQHEDWEEQIILFLGTNKAESYNFLFPSQNVRIQKKENA